MAKVTHRRVLFIALPIVLSNITVPLLGLVDTGVVGQLGRAEPIGAVGLGALILSSIYWVFGFLRMGVTGLVAQALGARDHPEMAALLWRGLIIGFAAGLCFIALQYPLFAAGFALSPAGGEVEDLARDYMGIRIWSAPAAIAGYAITGWLIGSERTRAVLILQLWINGVNIALDFLFVPGLGWGVGGVAWATFIAEWSGLGLGLWLCRDGLRGPCARILDRARLRHMAVVNGDILIRSVLLQGVMVSFLMWGAGFGDVNLAANQVLLQFFYVTAHGLDGFAFATETLVGQAIGARNRTALRQSLITVAQWAVGLSVLMAVGFWFAGPMVIDLLTNAPDVRDVARTLLPWVVLAPIAGVGAWILDGVFIGATATRDMRNMMIVSVLVYVVCAFGFMALWGNHGLWLALLVCLIVRGLTLALRYPALVADVSSPTDHG